MALLKRGASCTMYWEIHQNFWEFLRLVKVSLTCKTMGVQSCYWKAIPIDLFSGFKIKGELYKVTPECMSRVTAVEMWGRICAVHCGVRAR